MTERDKRSFHIVFNLLLVVLFATLETSLWPRVFSPIPNPQIWLSVVVFVFLYRTPVESLLIVYIPSLCLYLLTMQPLGYLLLAQTFLFFLVLAVRNRVFVPGQFYYSVMYASSVLVFHILMFIFAWVFETQPTSLSQVLTWFIQSILAFVISPFLYSLIKRITPIEETIDSEGGSFL
ncbi:MAG: hypothetical protein V4596_00235 [Bdellovibrionota bacterium]